MHGAEERQKASQTLQPDVGFLRMPPNCSSTLVLHEGTRLSLQSGNQKFADKVRLQVDDRSWTPVSDQIYPDWAA